MNSWNTPGPAAREPILAFDAEEGRRDWDPETARRVKLEELEVDIETCNCLVFFSRKGMPEHLDSTYACAKFGSFGVSGEFEPMFDVAKQTYIMLEALQRVSRNLEILGLDGS